MGYEKINVFFFQTWLLTYIIELTLYEFEKNKRCLSLLLIKDPVTIPVSINVVKRDFGILTPSEAGGKNGPTSLIDFGSIFVGSDAIVV